MFVQELPPRGNTVRNSSCSCTYVLCTYVSVFILCSDRFTCLTLSQLWIDYWPGKVRNSVLLNVDNCAVCCWESCTERACVNTGGPDNLFEIWKICIGILRASYLKQNVGGHVDIFLQNKRKRTSIVVICRPCSRKWRILANIGHFEGLSVRRLPERNTKDKGGDLLRTAPAPSRNSPRNSHHPASKSSSKQSWDVKKSARTIRLKIRPNYQALATE